MRNEIAIVVDRSGIMNSEYEGIKAITSIKEALTQLVSNRITQRDYFAIVSYAGKAQAIEGGDILSTQSDAILNSTLTDHIDDLKAAIAAIAVPSPCENPASPRTVGLAYAMFCLAGIGQALSKAVAELNSGRHITGAKQTILLISSGAESVNDPLYNSAAITTAAKAAGIDVITIRINMVGSYQATFDAFATTGKAHDVEFPEDAAGIICSVPHEICAEEQPYNPVYEPYVPLPGFTDDALDICTDLSCLGQADAPPAPNLMISHSDYWWSSGSDWSPWDEEVDKTDDAEVQNLYTADTNEDGTFNWMDTWWENPELPLTWSAVKWHLDMLKAEIGVRGETVSPDFPQPFWYWSSGIGTQTYAMEKYRSGIVDPVGQRTPYQQGDGSPDPNAWKMVMGSGWTLGFWINMPTP